MSPAYLPQIDETIVPLLKILISCCRLRRCGTFKQNDRNTAFFTLTSVQVYRPVDHEVISASLTLIGSYFLRDNSGETFLPDHYLKADYVRLSLADNVTAA